MRKVFLIVAAVTFTLVAGVANAADKLKIGVLATLEGTYTVLGEDGVRGFKTALGQFKSMAGGREIEVIREGEHGLAGTSVHQKVSASEGLKRGYGVLAGTH